MDGPGKLFLLLCCAVLVLTQTQPSQWGCYPVTSQEGVNISQVLGQWYLVGGYFLTSTTKADCIGLNISWNDNMNSLLFQQFKQSGDDVFTTYNVNFTLEIHTPSLWKYGSATARICSLPAIYSVLVYIVMGAVVVLQGVHNLQYLNDHQKRFDEIVISIILMVMLIPHVALPIRWWETPELVDHVNRWDQLELDFCRVTGRELSIPLKRSTAILSFGLVSVIGVLMVALSILRTDTNHPWIDGIYLFYTFTAMFIQVALWFYMMRAFQMVAEQMGTAYKQESFLTASKIGHYRCLWLQLQQLLVDTGRILCHSYIILMFLWFLNLVLSLYGLISGFLDHGLNLGQIIMSFLVLGYACALFFICDSAQQASEGVEAVFRDPNKQMTCFTPGIEIQVRLLKQTVRMNSTTISLGGYFNVDRALMTTILTTIASYLIILVQFKLAFRTD